MLQLRIIAAKMYSYFSCDNMWGWGSGRKRKSIYTERRQLCIYVYMCICTCLSLYNYTCKLWEIVKAREAWHAAVQWGCKELNTTEQLNSNNHNISAIGPVSLLENTPAHVFISRTIADHSVQCWYKGPFLSHSTHNEVKLQTQNFPLSISPDCCPVV